MAALIYRSTPLTSPSFSHHAVECHCYCPIESQYDLYSDRNVTPVSLEELSFKIIYFGILSFILSAFEGFTKVK